MRSEELGVAYKLVSLPLEGKGDRRTAVDEVRAERIGFAQTSITPLTRLHLISQPIG